MNRPILSSKPFPVGSWGEGRSGSERITVCIFDRTGFAKGQDGAEELGVFMHSPG